MLIFFISKTLQVQESMHLHVSLIALGTRDIEKLERILLVSTCHMLEIQLSVIWPSMSHSDWIGTIRMKHGCEQALTNAKYAHFVFVHPTMGKKFRAMPKSTWIQIPLLKWKNPSWVSGRGFKSCAKSLVAPRAKRLRKLGDIAFSFGKCYQNDHGNGSLYLEGRMIERDFFHVEPT